MECPICLSNITDIEKDIVTTNCGHTFHTSCLIQNVLQNGANCPYCRGVMTTHIKSQEEEEFENLQEYVQRFTHLIEEEEDDSDGEEEYDIHMIRREEEERVTRELFTRVPNIREERGIEEPLARITPEPFMMAPDLHTIACQLIYRYVVYEDLVACLLWKEKDELRIDHDIAREDYFRKYVEIMDKLYIINELYPRVRRDN